MLLVPARCPRKQSEDFMTSPNDFYVFDRFAGLQNKVFFPENSPWSNMLNYL